MRALTLVLLILLILGAAFGPALFAPREAADDTLVLLSPHWDGIRDEFGGAFARHWKARTGRTVRVDWWDVGGTGEIRRFIAERAKKADWERGEGIGVDVLFGGGTYDYENFAKEGRLAPHLPPAETLRQIPEQAAGQPLRDAQGYWHAACLTGFGLVYNRLVVERVGLPVPATWADLARPEYRGWVSCGDPTQSGSVHVAFEIILQARGWEDGWGLLARLAANVPAFNEGASSTPRDVSLGQAAAGPCIDFYAAAPVRRQGATHLEFVFPKGLSAITADAIALFRNAPHPEVAAAFEDFVLSEEGQRLWYQKRGTPGGPERFDLERLPVQPRLYGLDLPTYTVARPFEQGQVCAYDNARAGRRYRLLEDLWRATLLDVHADLRAAWAAVVRAGRAEDLGAALGRPPFAEEKLFAVAARKLAPGPLNALRRRWTGWARAYYRAIRQAAEAGTPAPPYAPAPDEP